MVSLPRLLAFGVSLISVVQAGEFGKRHVLLFGIDGLRADALKVSVEKGAVPNLAGLIATGAVTWTAYTGGTPDTPTFQSTVSGPGWSSVLTGVWTDKHGVTDNGFKGSHFDRYPNFFERLHEGHPQAKFVSLVSWSPIHESIIPPSPEDGRMGIVRHTFGHEERAEAKLIAETAREISSTDPDIVFCYQGDVDHAGHGYGFSPDVPKYMAAIAMADARIGEVLEAVRKRPGFAEEEWLFVVATDHGGKGTRHGGQSPEERTIPLIVSGGGTPKGLVSDEAPGQTCVPATICRFLGVEIPDAWEWDATVFPAKP